MEKQSSPPLIMKVLEGEKKTPDKLKKKIYLVMILIYDRYVHKSTVSHILYWPY